MRTFSDSERPVVIDAAGAFHGGAARFLGELDRWQRENPKQASCVEVIGRNLSLTPRWLIERELLARRYPLRIALNNAAFRRSGGENVVLLRNALHFCGHAELRELRFKPSNELRAQIPVIRYLANRADRIVVPCVAMAERVLRYLPGVSARLVVRGHPVTQPSWAGSAAERTDTILVPIVPSPYKNLESHVRRLLESTEELGLRAVLTATDKQMPGLSGHERVEFVGLQSADSLERYWRRARAIYYPTGLEAFGYPLAEARVAGRWIIAQDTAQNHEIAGRALAPFSLRDEASLRTAVELTAGNDPIPDPSRYNPADYFSWLIGDVLGSA